MVSTCVGRLHQDVDEVVVAYGDKIAQEALEGLSTVRFGQRLHEQLRPAADIGGLTIATEAHRAQQEAEGGGHGAGFTRFLKLNVMFHYYLIFSFKLLKYYFIFKFC